MNLVIKNQNYKIIDSLTIDIIKTLTGEYTKEDISTELINFIYNEAIIDITAIKNYYDIKSTLDFLSFFDASRVIILLNDSELINANNYLGYLVQNGYYNFTRNAAGINYLLTHPNKYDDVKKYLVSESNNLNNYSNVSNSSPNNFGVQTSVNVTEEKNVKQSNCKIIGLQNITEHAGATTLMYMMVKQLKINYHVKGIEMFKQDSIYFHDNDLTLCTSVDELKIKLKSFSEYDAILIDLNDFDAKDFCDEILYLIEPGTIRLNKAIKKDSNIAGKVRSGKVIINRSSIKEEEINNFEYETKFNVFVNIPNFNERADRIQIIDRLLIKLGFKKQDTQTGGLFNIFK